MLKKIKEYLQKKQEALKKEQELKKAQAYYRLIKAGSEFIKFVQQDLEKAKGDMNRHLRRRMVHDLNEKGVLSPEIVEYYAQKIDYILSEVHKRLNPPKPPKMQNNPNVQVRTTKPEEIK